MEPAEEGEPEYPVQNIRFATKINLLNRKKAKVELMNQRALEMQRVLDSPSFDDVRDALRNAGITVMFKPNGRNAIHNVKIVFLSETRKVKVDADFQDYGDVQSGFFRVFDEQTYEIEPLSCLAAKEWYITAERIGLPRILTDVVRFTEWFIALFAVLGSQESFQVFYRNLTTMYKRPRQSDTSILDTYYAGHGGDMQVMFPIKFGNPDVHFGHRYEYNPEDL